MGKAKTAAIKIFSYIDSPSKINAVEPETDSIPIDKETFKGKIEFRDVWFRYPTRKNDWILIFNGHVLLCIFELLKD